MSNLDRLKEYAKPLKGPQGSARDTSHLDYWADRAKDNSRIAPRASDGDMKLPSNKVNVRDTAMAPKVSRKVDARMAAKSDLNHVGSNDVGAFMKSVRRGA